MFRDSRGVVHTVSSADPLADLPPGAVRALQDALLAPPPAGTGPGQVDVGGVLSTAEAVRDLLERWQDAFFASLPDEIDLQEEARWAAEAGLSLEEVEGDWDDDTDPDDEIDVDLLGLDDDDDDLDELDDLELLLDRTGADVDDDPRAALPEPLVTALERELLLLPVRVRLEALVAAGDLVQEWADLVADQEKLLGHLVLAHGQLPQPQELGHEQLAARHGQLHAATGPGHRERR
ncbi:MAG TPA: hypothetical protein VM433_12875 [Mycobacteriales bacterium]|nr:hypothetical protein [Mycobacteriales bacterium]